MCVKVNNLYTSDLDIVVPCWLVYFIVLKYIFPLILLLVIVVIYLTEKGVVVKTLLNWIWLNVLKCVLSILIDLPLSKLALLWKADVR